MTVEARGLNEAILRLRELPDTIRAGIGAAVYGEAVRLQTAIKAAIASLPIRQGENAEKLRRGIFIRMEDGTTRIVATVGTPGVLLSSKYGTFNIAAGLEYGTVAHIIRARFARALAFPMGGALIFRRQVNHPGTPGYGYIHHTFAVLAPSMRARLSTSVAALLEGVTS